MSKLTDIKQKILQLDGGAFQELCDAYLYKLGYANVLSLGMKSGTMKTTKGIPDTYFLDPCGKYIFVMYTTQQSNVYEKIYEDICDCLNQDKTGVAESEITEIIYCHTTSNLTAGKSKELRDYCLSRGVLLQLYGIDELASNIYTRYHGISRDFLGISMSTEQIFEVKEFISVYDSNEMAAPLSTTFQSREEEFNEVLAKIELASVTLITGPAGVGKTRLALECCKKYAIENNYRLFCIQSNRLPIYEDLKVFLDTPNKYLLLIDDANQISGLHHILQYLTKHNQGYDVKIVATVRDYARHTTIQDIRTFTNLEVCTINTFSDEEIRKLLEINLHIKNSKYLDKIVRIAEGNARLAIIAGKLAVETQTLSSINDATQLYEGYYGKFIQNNIFNQNRDLCAVAGIIAFLTAINLEYLENLHPLLETLGISINSFLKYAYQLHELELVDIYNDKAAKISDQCLGNYLLSYVFIEKRIIPLSVMVKCCFKSYKPRVINSINILANIFASKDMHQQIEKEIGIVWDDLEKSQSSYFFDFVKVFHSIRPTETLLMLKERVEALPQESFDINSINFEEESRSKSVDDDILTIIGGFHDKTELPEALDLFFEYYRKKPQEFMDFYHAINRFFGVNNESHRYDYWTQIQLLNKFIEHANAWEDKNVDILFIRVAPEFLKLHFSPTKAGRGNTIIMYQIPVQLTDGSKKYRELIWNGLFELYQQGEAYQAEIEKIIKEYGRFNRDKIEIELVQLDFQFILRFFNELFSPLRLSHCIIAKEIADQYERLGIEVQVYLADYLRSADYVIFKTLKGERYLGDVDSKMYQEIKESNIRALLKDCTKETIVNIVRICFDVQMSDSKDTWNLSDGLHYVFNQISDKELFLYAVEIYLANNTPIDLYPDLIICKLFDMVGIDQTYKIIDKFEFSQKNNWQYSFYRNLPADSISNKYVQSLYDFLSMKEDIISSPYRDMNFLDKYKDIDEQIFIKAARIIAKKYDYSPSIFSLYFHPMFSSYGDGTKSEIIIDQFKNDLALLKEVYFKLISYNRYIDINGQYLIHFIRVDFSFIEDFIQYTLKDTHTMLHDDENRLSAIWNCKDYIQLIDYIVKAYFCNENLYLWQVVHHLSNIFKVSNNEDLINHQDEWISQFIEDNFDNSESMKILFSSIAEAEMSPERRKKHIMYLIKLNSDPTLFEELQLEPSGYGGMGSMIPYMEERISFLESLLPPLTGLKYLKHKRRVERSIDEWRRLIEREQIDEVLTDL